MRTLNAILIALTLAGAYALYALNYGTRSLEAKVQAAERTLERLESDIQIMTAERAHLASPERIERLAREQGLGPAKPGQLRVAPAKATENTDRR
jgi:cell division protein FtsL